MTAVLPDVDPDRVDDDPHGFHWVCVTVNDHPHIALCGELVSGRRDPHATAGEIHDTCRDLAREHIRGCPRCAVWARRLGL